MLILSIHEARPGLKLATSVMHPGNPGQELLRPGFVLTEATLERLRELEVVTLYVDYPNLAGLDEFLEPTLSPARREVYQQIRKTIDTVQRTARPTVSFTAYYAAMRGLITSLMERGPHLIYMDDLSLTMGRDEVAHATAVAQLSITIGIRIQQYVIDQRPRLPAHHAKELVNLGVGGMLHDIGKIRLPQHLRDFNGVHLPENPGDLRLWQTHAEMGRDMVSGCIEPSAAAVVSQHHQRFDGSGFPAIYGDHQKPLGGLKIHIFGRISGVADLYDRLTVENGRRRTSLEIHHLLRTRHLSAIDPIILKALPQVIPPFPPGSPVTLSDGNRAVVTGLNLSDPYRPIVRVFEDETLELLREPISLADREDLNIEQIGDVSTEGMIPAAANALARA